LPAARPAAAVRPAAAGAVVAAVSLVLLGIDSFAVAAGLGVATAAATRVVRRGRQRAMDAAVQRDAPLFLEVVASLLRAGAPVALALERAAPLAPGPLIGAVREVAGLARLGAGPVAAWRPLEDTVLGDLALLARRSSDSGVRLGEQTRTLAAQIRQQCADRSHAAARRAGVWAMAPLGLCFLPAFFCLGVLPVIAGLGRGLLGEPGGP
jgi:Flp pilus assembly protein TadB